MADLNAAKSYDPSDPAQVAEREKQAQIRQLGQERMLREQLSTPAGRNFYWDQLAACHVFETISPGDEATTNYLLGERNVGLRIMSDIMRAAPESFIQMLKERGNA